MKWFSVCTVEKIQPERGVAALVDDMQIALIKTYDGALFAVGNKDPFAGAQVMSRGIVGTRGETPTLASPLHKQVYDLRTGECLDVPGVRLPTFPVRCENGIVEVALST
ncbi:nitrite reductase small subunit NirD [Catelliglobosispora koreensis]|uniref:nitrite reductase small subunit NirD n=1 Tax=Catelliglobosispora koreensis TaxID=129052 RepID=UPI00035CD80E|nr:nitrite reductase small subunit NirD [Catelliglobosispora koreensis]